MYKNFTLLVGLISSLLIPEVAYSQSWEVYDTKLQLQSRLIYDDVDILSETVRIGKTGTQLSLLTNDLNPAVQLVGTEIYQYFAPWILVKGPTGIGAFHEYGQQVLPLEYEKIDTYFNMLLASKGKEYWLFERGKNKTTYLGELEEAKITNTGLLIIRRGNEYSLPLSFNPDKIFDFLSDNEGEFVLAKEASGFGLINREGDYVLDPIIEALQHTHGNFYYGFNQEQYVLIEGNDIKSNIRYNSFHKITFENDIMLEYIHGKLRRVMEDDGILLDDVGITSVNKIGKDLYNVHYRDAKIGLLGKKGWLVKPMLEVEEIKFGNEALFPAKSKGNFGFVNSAGTWIIKPQYAETTLFSEKIAAYRTSQNWGLISTSGEAIGTASWDEIKPFDKGIAIARSSGKFYLLNKAGSSINTEGFDNVFRTTDGYFMIEKSGKTGLLNSEGSEVIPAVFEKLRRERKDFIIAQKDGLTGVITESGEVVIPLAYEKILVDWENNLIFTKTNYVPTVIQVVEESGKKNKKGA
ncbi:WG repeat protein [Algoriphagus ratkowskyi]|uniref:WG repeat protein n=1 Tax=Algoriphagus ratkowskyi TaxID=57028 RepID=A0A2W7S132_9BACT|nr:WG repeat-containing protein [Algoriphagus ratkowskyi]PZX61077.1 WG repeat protein [Algoriphagus ratkowskyi]TXD79212.1 WG repeat-containing protein [Algoriphagus ratkowskyi]